MAVCYRLHALGPLAKQRSSPAVSDTPTQGLMLHPKSLLPVTTPALTLSILIGVGILLWPSFQGSSPPELRLVRVNSVSIPHDFSVDFVFAAEGEPLALASFSVPYILVQGYSSQEFRRIGEGVIQEAVAVATFDGGRAIQVVDRGSQKLVMWSPDGEGSEVDLSGLGKILAAGYTDGRWVVVTLNADTIDISSVSETRVERVARLNSWTADRLMPTVAIGPDGQVVIIHGPTEAPAWSLVQLDPGTARRPRHSRLDPPPDPNGDDLLDPLWVSSGLVFLGDWLLHTMTDIRSDSRLLYLRTPWGMIERTKAIAAPLYFLASDDSHVIAVSNLYDQEIVYYRMEWGEG